MILIGNCHCGGVEFEINAEPDASGNLQIHECNCSICESSGFLHLIVPSSSFRLLSGRNLLVEYRFRTKVARHLFCSICGVKSFYVPRSNPDGYSVNLNCLDVPDHIRISTEAVDGRNWSRNAAKLRHLSHS